jgi:Holliday junction resolvase RusA-like endonuclease
MTLLATQLELSSDPAAITFTVPTAPKAWARPRSRGRQFFKDDETRLVEDTIGTWALVAMRGREVIQGPVSLTVVSILPVPESWSRKKREAALKGELRPTGKPDFDNLIKAASDALNRIVYVDDCQVVDGRSIKFYGAEPAIQIAVRPANCGSVSGGTDGSFLEG